MAHKKDVSAVDNVFEYLMHNIQFGTWKPGDKIPSEADLCSMLNVSRVSVRSALGRLAALGLVQSKQGKGTFVSTPPSDAAITPLSLDNLDRLSLFEFRKIIEQESAALAAQRATTEDVLALQDSILKMESGETAAEIASQDLRFHTLIARASKNEIIQYVSQVTKEAYYHMFMENAAQLGAVGATLHRKILLDIQVRDADAARQHMGAHLDETVRLICDMQPPVSL